MIDSQLVLVVGTGALLAIIVCLAPICGTRLRIAAIALLSLLLLSLLLLVLLLLCLLLLSLLLALLLVLLLALLGPLLARDAAISARGAAIVVVVWSVAVVGGHLAVAVGADCLHVGVWALLLLLLLLLGSGVRLRDYGVENWVVWAAGRHGWACSWQGRSCIACAPGCGPKRRKLHRTN